MLLETTGPNRLALRMCKRSDHRMAVEEGGTRGWGWGKAVMALKGEGGDESASGVGGWQRKAGSWSLLISKGVWRKHEQPVSSAPAIRGI